jgi:sigma-E factor negative regulatory protein RseB
VTREVVIFFKFAFLCLGFVTLTAHADTISPKENLDAQAWLRKIHLAAQKLNYSGTFVYEQASQIRTSRVTHVLEGKDEREKLEILDGKPREFIRHNEEIVCYVPELKTLLVEKRITQDVFPAILAANPSELSEHYEIRKGETGRIAGYDAQSVTLDPKDNLRFGYRLWAEQNSGLLLRAQTLGDHGEVVEQIAFTQVTIGNIDRSKVKPSYINTAGWKTERAAMSQSALTGWSVKAIPAGFKKIREMRRMISDTPASNTTVNLTNHDRGAVITPAIKREISQIVYSDGLAAISVFIEPVSQSRTEGSMQQGAMNITGKRQGAFWLTIVGEVPSAAIKQVANSIEYKTR